MASLKTFLKSVVPARVLNIARARAARRVNRPFEGMDSRQIFSKIYNGGYWGEDGPDRFSSGDGSHSVGIVAPYVAAVNEFLNTLTEPSVVDLGCGDFNVGRQIRPQAGRYIACDIVPDLVARNETMFAALDVDFRCLDMARDPLPDGIVVLIRQVLQHLSNAEVAKVLPKLRNFRYAIITEHVPSLRFKPNLDKPTGPGTRSAVGSGLELTKPPFSMEAMSAQVICEVTDVNDTRIVTTLYRFN